MSDIKTQVSSPMNGKSSVVISPQPDPSQTAQDGLGEAHPLAAIRGIFKDDPIFEMVLENIRESRRKEAAEYAGDDNPAELSDHRTDV